MNEKLKKLLTWDKNDWFWLFFFIMLGLLIWGYQKDTAICKEIVRNPCDYCQAQIQNELAKKVMPSNIFLNYTDENKLNITKINITDET